MLRRSRPVFIFCLLGLFFFQANRAEASLRELQRLGDESNFQVIIFGDVHGDTPNHITHHQNALPYIARLGRPGDLLLLEGNDLGARLREFDPIHPLSAVSSQGIAMMGWENRGLFDLSGDLERQALEFHEQGDLSQELVYLQAFVDVVLVDRNRDLGATLVQLLAMGVRRIFVEIGTLHLSDPEFLSFFKDAQIPHLILVDESARLDLPMDFRRFFPEDWNPSQMDELQRRVRRLADRLRLEEMMARRISPPAALRVESRRDCEPDLLPVPEQK